jgi:hypothetical protein
MTDQRDRMKMARQGHGWMRAFALAAALSVAGPAARADVMVPCKPGTGYNYGPNPAVICGGAEGHGAGNGIVFNASPDPFSSFISGVGGAMGVAGVGVGGVYATASGSGGFGLIHLFASANNGEFTELESNGTHTGSAYGRAEIIFVDGGPVLAPVGSSVNLRFTPSMEGVFTGVGEGGFQFNVFDGISFVGSSSAFLYSGNPSVSQTLDLTVKGGDTLFFSMDMWVQANSTNDGTVIVSSIADASNTGRLFLDVLTPGAAFASNSGTDYSSVAAAAAAPEPGTALLLAAGLVGLMMRRNRTRRRHTASN